MKLLTIKSSILICLLFAVIAVGAQTNLLLNPNADSKAENWRVSGQAAVEEFNGDKVFVIHNRGSFSQDVNLTESDIGKFALFIGRGSSERIDADGAITGLPYLYGYMMNSGNPKGGRIYAYLQGQQMLARPPYQDEWVVMYGIFRIPEKTGTIRFFLSQAERKYVPQNGSAARFDNIGLYLFETEEDALRFAKAYK
jgi:hypothetical protein